MGRGCVCVPAAVPHQTTTMSTEPPRARRDHPVTLFRLGSIWLLVAAAGHAVAHALFYLRESSFTAERLAIVRVMQAFAADGIPGTSLWTIFQSFSLLFFLFLCHAGLHGLLTLRGVPDPPRLRRLAGFNAVFWSVSCALLAALHPVLQPLVITGVAFLFFGASYLTSPDGP